MQRIFDYKNIPVKFFCLFIIYTLVRQNEARCAEWSQFDLNKQIWTIPPVNVKTRHQLVVPLSSYAVDCIENIKSNGVLVFPSISIHAVSNMLKNIEYSNAQIVPHGFRAMGSTLLNELGYPRDLIDMSLGHSVGSAVSQIYNRSILFDARKNMMEHWGAYLKCLVDNPTKAFELHKFNSSFYFYL